MWESKLSGSSLAALYHNTFTSSGLSYIQYKSDASFVLQPDIRGVRRHPVIGDEWRTKEMCTSVMVRSVTF